MTQVERLSVKELDPSTILIDLGVLSTKASDYRFSIFSERDRRYKDTEGWCDSPIFFEPLEVARERTTKLIIRRGVAWGIPYAMPIRIEVPGLAYSEICHWPLAIGEARSDPSRPPVDPVALMLEELSRSSGSVSKVTNSGAPAPVISTTPTHDEDDAHPKTPSADDQKRRYVHLVFVAFALGALASWVWQGPAARLAELNFKNAQAVFSGPMEEKRRALEAREGTVADRERAVQAREAASSQRENSNKPKETDLERQAKVRELRTDERETKLAERERAVEVRDAANLQKENSIKVREGDFERQSKARELRNDEREMKLTERERSITERETMPRLAPPPNTPPGFQSIAGRLSRVESTNSLILEGQARPFQLAWITGYGEPYRGLLEKFLLEQGGQVRCDPAGDSYRCYVNNVDVGQAAVMNGTARPLPDAPRSYRVAESEARQRRRGLWRDAFPGLTPTLPGPTGVR